MFPSRPPVPPGPGPSYKFTVAETCERIKDEFNYVQQQCHQLQSEREKLLSERVDMQRICVVYYEMANGLNLEMHRQMEIAKRLNAILTQVIPFLAQEHQSQVASAIDRAKQVTMQELNSVLAAQMEDTKLSSKFADGGNPGLSNDQLEMYKQLQIHQMLAAGNAAAALPGGGSSSSNHAGPPQHPTGSSGGNSNNNPSNNNPFAGAANLLPGGGGIGPGGIPAALLNGLMSGAAAAGGVMMPPPGSAAGLPLGGGSAGSGSRDLKDFSVEEKQRVAAAAAAAASSLLYPGGRPGGQGGLPTSPFLPGGTAGFPEGLFGAPPPSTMAGNVPGRTSSGCGSGARHNSGLSGSQTSSLLPPPPPPTPGNSGIGGSNNNNSNALSSAGGGTHEEKRRKLADGKTDSMNRENGGWRSADDMDKSAPGAAASNPSRRHTKQPLNLSPQITNSVGSNYPTTNSAPAVGSALNRPPQTDSRNRYGGKNSFGPGAYSFVVGPGGLGERPCTHAASAEATSHPGLPRRLQHLASLPHGEVVCAVTIGPVPPGRNTSPASLGPGGDAEAAESAPISNSSLRIPHFAYTGGRGCVKLWDLDAVAAGRSSSPPSSSSRDVVIAMASFDCLRPDSYVRSIKLFPDASGLVIGGESNALTVWDLNGPGRRKADLTFDAPACYALALSPDSKLCYSCCSDGQVAIWDIHNQSVVQQFHAHVDGASCIELASQGTRLWTGGLDHKVRCWDIRASTSQRLHHFEFQSQVFSLGLSPACGLRGRRPNIAPITSDDAEDPFHGTQWLAVGLESSEVEVVAIGPDGPPPPVNSSAPVAAAAPSSPTASSSPSGTNGNGGAVVLDQHFRLKHHESCVLALRFAHHADWFVTTGKDHQVNAWRTPYGACLLETKEAASVLTCDISPDDKFVVTGSGDKRANLYEIIYAAGSVASSSSSSSSH